MGVHSLSFAALRSLVVALPRLRALDLTRGTPGGHHHDTCASLLAVHTAAHAAAAGAAYVPPRIDADVCERLRCACDVAMLRSLAGPRNPWQEL